MPEPVPVQASSGYRARLPLLAKLVVGRTDDPLEHEADRVAGQVLARPADRAVPGAPRPTRRVSEPSAGEAMAVPDSVGRVLAAPGLPLEPALRQDMERRFGYDFSHVRVHADGAAARSAADVRARAYTVGRDIIFGAGHSPFDRRLLAHELAHTLQQDGAPASRLLREPLPAGGAPPPHIRRIHLDTSVVDQLNRGNTAVAARLKALHSLGYELRISTPAETELTLKGNLRLRAANRLLLDELGIRTVSGGAGLSERVGTYEQAARTGIGVQSKDLPMVEAALRDGAELWTMDENLAGQRIALQRHLKVALAPESDFKFVTGRYDYARARRLVDLAPVEIAADGRVIVPRGSVTLAGAAARSVTSAVGAVAVPQRGLVTPVGAAARGVTSAVGAVAVPQRGSVTLAGAAARDVTSAAGAVVVPQRGSVTPAGTTVANPVTSATGTIERPKPGPSGGGIAVFKFLGTLLNVANSILSTLQAEEDFRKGDYVGTGLNLAAASGLFLPTVGQVAVPYAAAWEGTKAVAELTGWAGRCSMLVAAFETGEVTEDALRELVMSCPEILIGREESQRVMRAWFNGEFPGDY